MSFDDLLERRADLAREHALACEILAEEGYDPNGILPDRCRRLYAELENVQEQIDEEIEAERLAEDNQP